MMQYHKIELPLPLELRHVNVHVIQGDSGLALIDAGMATGTARDVLQRELQRLGVTPSDLSTVFITHFHMDHFGLASWLADNGTRVVMPRADADWLDEWFHTPPGDRGLVNAFAHYGVPQPVLERAGRAADTMRTLAPPFHVDQRVDDGDVLELAGEPFEIIVTPGHTPGHACLHHPATGALFVGDHVLPHITPNISLGPGLDDPLACYRQSLLALRGRGYAPALPAHGGPIADLDRRIDEILRHHVDREELLLEHLALRPAAALELADAVFRVSVLDPWDTWMAIGETLAHLRSLERQDRVRQLSPGDDRPVTFERLS
jgi:glyoxylase-like metal-dependent hydrolase (beta-lactamase superfamily II)